MDTVTFANGASYPCAFFATIPGKAFVALSDVTFAEAAAIFSSPEMTNEITYGNYVLHDFTTLDYLMQEPYGIKASLSGGYEERNE